MTTRSTIALLTAAILMQGIALAGGPSEDETFQSRVFGKPITKDKAFACFKRAYDANHLAHHAEQNVHTMNLLVTGYTNPAFYRLGLGVDFRRAGAHFETTGDCLSIQDDAHKTPGALHCGVACEGGAIGVSIKDTGAVLVSIPDGARVGAEAKRFGTDDKLFRLDPAPLSDCLPLANSDDDKAAMSR